MNAGTENRKKTIIAGALGTLALISAFYIYNNVFGSDTPSTPPPSVAPVTKPAPAAAPTTTAASRPAAMPTGNAAGVAAKKLATASVNLDPSLDQTAMLRTEHLVYSGSGRNIFSAIYTPPVIIPKPSKSVRNTPLAPPVYVPPPPPPTCPPTCPPINLKFFGTATRADGTRQAFLLQGEDVFLASKGDIVARKYKIVTINANNIQVEDLVNTNTQTLPLQSN